MKVQIDRDVLAEAVAWAARTLPARPPLPVLAGLLLEASDDAGTGQLVLSGFDYEVSARQELTADVGEPGRVLVSGRLLADICRSLPNKPVDLITQDSKVLVRCGSARFTLLTLPVEEYPALPQMPPTAGRLAGDLFAHAVAQVAVAAGRDDTLPVLTGVRMEIEGDRVTLAATDRYRLAVRELTWSPERSDASAIALVPAKSLSDTARALSNVADVSVALSTGSGGAEGLIGFEGDGRRTTQRLLDGEFPKYKSLLPSESNTVAVVETAAFVEAVKRVALVAERNTPVRLSFSGDELRLDAGTGEEAQASEQLDASLQGDDITIAFNPSFLLDGLAAISSPYASMSFTVAAKPAVITGTSGPEGEVDGSYRYLLMPVRVAG
ncbi:MAG: DNA polymerase III subunit beta [Actinomycetes bacterium]